MATPDLGQIMLGGMPDLQKQQAYRQWLDARKSEILAQLMNGNQFVAPEADPGLPVAPAKVVVPDWPSQFAELESVQAPQAAVMAGGTPTAPLVLEALMNPQPHVSPGFSFPPGLGPLEIVGDPNSSDPIKRRFGYGANMIANKLPLPETAYTSAPEVTVGGAKAVEGVTPTPAASSPSFTLSPDMYPFLLAAGAELMQPMPMWQTSAGHFGRAMQAGFGATQAQRQGEMDLRAKQAQIDQNMAATEQTRETTKNIPQEGRRISAQADLLLKELENYDELFKLKKEDLGVKIEQARKEGILTEARAKALKEDLQLRPDYQRAVINELNARAQYYRNGGSRGGGSGETAIEKNVKARAEVLRMKGIDPITALETAWQEVGMGARGDAVVNRKAQNLANLWRKQHERMVKEKKFDGTLEDYALEMAGEATLNATGDGSSVATAALEMLQNERNLAQQRTAPPGSANEPENKVRAKPVPTKRGADGRLVFDPSKMAPGEAYVFPDGEVRTWSGK